MTNKQKVCLVLIAVLAIFFRFYLITKMPGGLFPDEAANGLDINSMQQGHLQPFYERGNGREALFFYMEWGSVALFGKGVWQFHIVSSLVGVFSVLMCFFAARELFLINQNENDLSVRNRAVRIALLASFLMAVSHWPVILSRTAFRANLTPLFGALTFFFLIKTYRTENRRVKIWSAVLTGIVFALGFYTYIAFRIMMPILIFLVAWPLLAQIKYNKFWLTVKAYLPMGVGFLIAFLIVIFPIANYFYHHFDYFIGRSGQVSIFNANLYLVDGQQLLGKPALSVVGNVAAEVTKVAVRGFFIQGDLNWRQNISGYSLLSPLLSPFFGAGLIATTLLGIWYFFMPNKKSELWKYLLLLCWFWGMLVPEITTAEGIPHGLRSAGTQPAVFIISAWALYVFGTWIYSLHKRIWQDCWCHSHKFTGSKKNIELRPNVTDPSFHPHFDRFRFLTLALKAVVGCFCLALILQTYFLYFVYAYNSPENFYAFRSDLTPVSQYLIDRCQSSVNEGGSSTRDTTFLVLDKYSLQTTDYLTSDPKGNFNSPCNVPYKQVDPENSWQLPAILPGQEVVFTQSSIFDIKKFKQYHPEAHLVLEYRNKFGQAVMGVYEVQ